MIRRGLENIEKLEKLEEQEKLNILSASSATVKEEFPERLLERLLES
jgi:hypothetical protein